MRNIIQYVVDVHDTVLSNKSTTNLVFALATGLAGIAILIIALIALNPLGEPSIEAHRLVDEDAVAQSSDLSARYECADGKRIVMNYTGSEAQLFLSDGRDVTVLSANGSAGYASSDGSVLWRVIGYDAELVEEGVATYSGCVVTP